MDANQRAKARKRGYEEKLAPFPVTLNAKKSVGRFLTAKKDIAIGETVLIERAFATVLFQSSISLNCALCFRKSSPLFACADCHSQVTYCSLDCQESARKSHKIVCKIFANIAGISGSSGADDSLVRLIASCLAEKHLSGPSLEVEQVDYMVSHAAMAENSWTSSIFSAAEDIVTYLPFQCSTNQILKLGLQINANSFAIYDPYSAKTAIIGTGVYPLAALCNHSCFPNIHYTTNAAGCLEFIAIENLSAGQEIFDTYTDIYAGFDKRQYSLLFEKSFICKCLRCIDQSPSQTMQGLIGGCHDDLDDLKNISLQIEDFIKIGQFEVCYTLAHKWLLNSRTILHENHHLRLEVLVLMTNICVKLQDLDSAIMYTQKAYRIMEETGPKLWPEKTDLQIELAHMLMLKDPEKGRELMMEALDSLGKLYGPNHQRSRRLQGILSLD